MAEVPKIIVAHAPMVKAEKPVEAKPSDPEDDQLYKKLIAENQRLMKENKSEKIKKLCDHLQAENDRLVKATKAADSKNADHEKARKLLEAKIKKEVAQEAQERLKDGALQELSRAEDKINKLEGENKKLTDAAKDSDNLQKLCKNLQAENDRLIKAQKDADDKNADHEKTRKLLEAKIKKEALQEAQERLKDGALQEVSRAEDKIKKLEGENKKLTDAAKDSDNLQKLCDNLQSENDRLIKAKKDADDKNNDHEKARKLLEAKLKKEAAQEAQERLKDGALQELARAENKIQTLEGENQKLSETAKDSDNLQKLCVHLQAENKRLMKAAADSNADHEKARQLLEAKLKKTAVQEAQERLKDGALQELARAEEKIKSVESEKKKLADALKELEKDQKDSEHLQELCKNLQAENDRLVKEKKYIEKKLNDYNKVRKLLEEKIKQNPAPEGVHELLKNGIIDELDRAEDKIKSLEAENKQQEDLYKKLQKENEQLQAEIYNQAKPEKSEPEKGLVKTIAATKVVKSAKDKEDELGNLQKENDQLKAEIKKFEKSEPKTEVEPERELVKVIAATKAVKSAIPDKPDELEELQKDNERLKELCKDLQAEYKIACNGN